ncbi:DUF2497 domain-containing protein [Peteryoungia desertarenae]|uniref:DUF2497 domain-containing protein n=1 Tax=Peteryoungia desertarenae TaxID=1813451 RepID=A0ABX6QPV3_9HYPH|nr:DUF2497 domain-containing protein [Peteryoungia desertarenae]QLF70282.1 DUF2497 domain-containing protein [Peteryoungia desertarenae]
MAQPSVAREPSMEEILASIRRIIESNDPVNGKSDDLDLGEAYASAADAGEIGTTSFDLDETDLGSLDFTPANDRGPVAAAPEPEPVFPSSPQPAPSGGINAALAPKATAAPAIAAQPSQIVAKEPQKSVSLADLAARVRSASERFERPAAFSGERRHADMGKPMESPILPQRLAELRAPLVQASAAMAAMELPASATEPTLTPEMETKSAGLRDEHAMDSLAEIVARQEPVTEVGPVMEEEQVAAAPAVEAPAMEQAPLDVTAKAAPAQELATLISETTVQQVSRSFGELAAAIDGQQRRSLDEMAEEMLRPMLREWLDDNLPTLVERLVREEIERVARGPRR